MMAWPIVSEIPAIQTRYEYARNCGSAHVWAEMFAFRKAPGCRTNRELFRGCPTLAEQFRGEEFVLDKLVKKAERLGRKPHYTDLYQPGLCRPEVGAGDPIAFVPYSEGSTHIKAVCDKYNMDVRGLVNYSTPTLDPPKKQLVKQKG